MVALSRILHCIEVVLDERAPDAHTDPDRLLPELCAVLPCVAPGDRPDQDRLIRCPVVADHRHDIDVIEGFVVSSEDRRTPFPFGPHDALPERQDRRPRVRPGLVQSEPRDRARPERLLDHSGADQARGHDDHEQGISKAGNRRIRAMAIEIAWGWLRFQPDSELSQWYERRFGGGSARLKKIGIVALARKLLVKLWLFLETGEVPQGAVLTG